jgi:hypothetical protein
MNRYRRKYPDQSSIGNIRLGDELEATIIAKSDYEESPKKHKPVKKAIIWDLQCHQLPQGWTANLRSLSGQLYEPGDRDTFWVWGISLDKSKILVSDTNFGRQPISDRMRPRYIRALHVLDKISSQRNEIDNSISLDDLSELSGMFNRIARADQWDWFTLWQLFSFPPRRWLAQVASEIKNLRRLIKECNLELLRNTISWIQHELSKYEVSAWLAAVENTGQKLPDALVFKTYRPSYEEKPALSKESDPYIVSQTARIKIERANKEHEDALESLANLLSTYGFKVEQTRLIDAYTRLKTGPAIFEVKSINRQNERSQCRHALSQLYEYRYLHNLQNASLWLVLSRRPIQDWLITYLTEDRGINLLWVESGKIKGPASAILLSSKKEDYG